MHKFSEYLKCKTLDVRSPQVIVGRPGEDSASFYYDINVIEGHICGFYRWSWWRVENGHPGFDETIGFVIDSNENQFYYYNRNSGKFVERERRSYHDLVNSKLMEHIDGLIADILLAQTESNISSES